MYSWKNCKQWRKKIRLGKGETNKEGTKRDMGIVNYLGRKPIKYAIVTKNMWG